MLQYTEKQELLYKESVKLLHERGTASRVLFQRMLAIGYEEACEIFDRMIEEEIAVKNGSYDIVLNTKGEKRRRMNSDGLDASEVSFEALGIDKDNLTSDSYIKLARVGCQSAFRYLDCFANIMVKNKTDEEKNLAMAEEDFWKTVEYMLTEYRYNHGNLRYEKPFGLLLLGGFGCEENIERGTELLVSSLKHDVELLTEDEIEGISSYCSERFERGCRKWESKLMKALLEKDASAVNETVERIKTLENGVDVLADVASLFAMARYDIKYMGGKR